jgi:hypothetical protein
LNEYFYIYGNHTSSSLPRGICFYTGKILMKLYKHKQLRGVAFSNKKKEGYFANLPPNVGKDMQNNHSSITKNFRKLVEIRTFSFPNM